MAKTRKDLEKEIKELEAEIQNLWSQINLYKYLFQRFQIVLIDPEWNEYEQLNDEEYNYFIGYNICDDECNLDECTVEAVYDDDGQHIGPDCNSCDIWNNVRIEHEEELWHKYSSRAAIKRSYFNRPKKSGKQLVEERILAQHNDNGEMSDLDDVLLNL